MQIILPWDDASHDVAYILLDVPKIFLQEYLLLRNQTGREFPEGQEFWLETDLCHRLHGKTAKSTHEDLEDILEFLGGKVDIHFYGDRGERVRLGVYEVPQINLE